MCRNLTKHKSKTRSLAIFENNFLISGDENGQIHIWNQTSFELLQILNDHSNDVSYYCIK